jgi:hypothetical protein
MASSEQTCLRFFVIACCFGLLIGVVGCATNNWSKPLFHQGNKNSRMEQSIRSSSDSDSPAEETRASLKHQWNRFWNAGFGSSSGLDPKAREIEKSLGL